jgi:HSP20 family protein
MSQQNLQNTRPPQRSEPSSTESTRGALCCTPSVDIYETETELLLYADLPGVQPQDVDLRYERGELTLNAKAPTSPPAGQLLAGEFEAVDYHRMFRVNEAIDASRIDAEFKQGVLIVHLPKQEEARPKQVQIRAK